MTLQSIVLSVQTKLPVCFVSSKRKRKELKKCLSCLFAQTTFFRRKKHHVIIQFDFVFFRFSACTTHHFNVRHGKFTRALVNSIQTVHFVHLSFVSKRRMPAPHLHPSPQMSIYLVQTKQKERKREREKYAVLTLHMKIL